MEIIFKYAKEHLIGFIFSVIFGAVATTLLFYFTSTPTSSNEVRKRLKLMALNEAISQTKHHVKKITFDSVLSESLDLSKGESYFVYGTFNSDANIFRFLALFEAKSPNVLDKLVGRTGFYNLKSFSYISVPDIDALLPEDIQIKDIDLDGNKEILIRVKSVWADSSSSGMIVLKKSGDEKWHFLSITSLSKQLIDFFNKKVPHPIGHEPAGNPNIWFGKAKIDDVNIEPIIESYKQYRPYEDEWLVVHNGIEQEFITLRNGGVIKQFEHPYTNYKQLGLIANLADGNPVLGEHHIMVTFLKIGEKDLNVDLLWNWGYPMFSIEAEDISHIDLKEFHDVGISSHVVNKIFFGYTEFRKALKN